MESQAKQVDVAVATPDPPRFWWLRRMCVLTIVWAVVVFGLWKWWHASAERRLNAEIEAIRARGEPLELLQVKTPMAFDHRAAGADVALAARMYYQLRQFGPGRRARTFLLPTDPRHLPPEMEDGIERINEVLEVAKRAAEKPVGPLPSQLTTGLAETATLVRAASLKEHVVRRDREALSLVAAVLQQADIVFVSGSSLKFHQTGVDARRGAASALMQMTPTLRIEPERSRNPAKRDQATALVKRLLDESHLAASFTRAWQAERAQRIYVSQSPVYGRSPVTVYRHDMVRAIRQTTRLVEASRGKTFPSRQVRELTIGRGRRAALAVWAQRTSDFYIDEGWMPAIRGHYDMLADARAAAVHLAIKLYAIDHKGEPPATLEALVPAYLPAVPRDPFGDGNRAMSYRVVGRHVVVFSVGHNGRDDVGPKRDITTIKPARNGTVRQEIGGADDVAYPLILPEDIL